MTDSYDKTFNICTARCHSVYVETEDEVRDTIRSGGVRFVDMGHADYDYRLDDRVEITRVTDHSVNIFHLFRFEDDFAGFVPVQKQDLQAVLDFIATRNAERTAV